MSTGTTTAQPLLPHIVRVAAVLAQNELDEAAALGTASFRWSSGPLGPCPRLSRRRPTLHRTRPPGGARIPGPLSPGRRQVADTAGSVGVPAAERLGSARSVILRWISCRSEYSPAPRIRQRQTCGLPNSIRSSSTEEERVVCSHSLAALVCEGWETRAQAAGRNNLLWSTWLP